MQNAELIVGLWRVTTKRGEAFAAFFADHIYAAPSSFRSELYARGHWGLADGVLSFEAVGRPEFPEMGQRSWQLTVRELSTGRMITEAAGQKPTAWERLGGEPDIDPALDPFTRVNWRVMHHPSQGAPAA